MIHGKQWQELADILAEIDCADIETHCSAIALNRGKERSSLSDRNREEISNLLDELNAIPMRSPYE